MMRTPYVLYVLLATISAANSDGIRELEKLESWEKRIIGEKEKIYGDIYPFFIRVETPLRFCGGSIVDERTVLTSASCLYSRSRGQWTEVSDVTAFDRVFLFHASKDKTGYRFPADNYYIHPDYDPGNHNNQDDIAILKLKKNINMTHTGRTWYRSGKKLRFCNETETYEKVVAAGTGSTVQNPIFYPQALKAATVEENPGCEAWKTEGLKVDSEKQICFGSGWGNFVGLGDTGGPLFYVHKRSPTCLLGIISMGPPPCNNGSLPGVFTRISYYSDWIEKRIS